MKKKASAIIVLFLLVVSMNCDQTEQYNYIVSVNGEFGLEKSEFISSFRMSREYRGMTRFTTENLKKYIEDYLLQNIFLLAEGYSRGYDQDSLLLASLDFQKRKILTGKNGPLFRAILPTAIQVDSNEVRDFYQKRAVEMRVAHILVKSRTLADSITKEIANGADFSRLAKEYSSDLRTGKNGGQLPRPMIYGQMGAAYDDACFALKTGETSTPIRTPPGYYIIQMLERKPRQQKPYDQARNILEVKLKKLKILTIIDDYIQNLYQKFNVRIDRKAAASFLKATRLDPHSNAPKTESGRLTPEQKNALIVRGDGGEISVAQLITIYNSIPPKKRTRFNNVDDVEDFIRRYLVEVLKYEDAKLRNLAADENFVKEFKNIKDRMITKMVQQKLVKSQVQVADYEAKDYYQKHPAQYKTRTYAQAKAAIINSIRAQKQVNQLYLLVYNLKKKYIIEYNEALLAEARKELLELRKQLEQSKTGPALPEN